MADVAIVNHAVTAAPKDYTLSGGQELFLKAVTASIDGSGSAVAWSPCLQVLAPDGTVMVSAVTSATVAAGASADVSWFPGIGTNAGAGGSAAQSYVGTNAIGPNTDFPGNFVYRWIYKKIVLATPTLITNIDAYCVGNSNNPSGLFVGVAYDNAGTPGDVKSASTPGNTKSQSPFVANNPMLNVLMDTTPLWVSVPASCYLTAGTWWLYVVFGGSEGGSDSLDVFYANGGHDFSNTDGNTWWNWAIAAAATDSGRTYSIRASTIAVG